MIKIGLLSDIHNHRHDQQNEINDLIEYINRSPTPELIIHAGDISHRTSEILGFLSSINVPCPKCWIPGNHDVWVIDKESPKDSPENRYRKSFAELSKKAGWHYLPREPLISEEGNFAVVGSIGWFTDEGFSEWYDDYSSERDQELAHQFSCEVEDQIKGLDDELRIILVSHHLVHERIPSISMAKGALWNSNMQQLFSKYSSRISAVFHGHAHNRYDPVLIEGAIFVSHPFGYPREHESVEDGYIILEIPL